MSTTRPTLDDACRVYVNRYTMEHVPDWAKHRAPGGGYYAPQYRTDEEWYTNTKFPGEAGNPQVPGTSDCYTTGQTWPLGKWLNEPYQWGQPTTAWQPTHYDTRKAALCLADSAELNLTDDPKLVSCEECVRIIRQLVKVATQ